MESQAGFQLTRIDEEAKPLKRLGAQTKVAVAVHSVLNSKAFGGKSLAESRVDVNAFADFHCQTTRSPERSGSIN